MCEGVCVCVWKTIVVAAELLTIVVVELKGTGHDQDLPKDMMMVFSWCCTLQLSMFVALEVSSKVCVPSVCLLSAATTVLSIQPVGWGQLYYGQRLNQGSIAPIFSKSSPKNLAWPRQCIYNWPWASVVKCMVDMLVSAHSLPLPTFNL